MPLSTDFQTHIRTISHFEFHHLEPHQQGAVLAHTSAGKLEELPKPGRTYLHEFVSRYAGLIYRYAHEIHPIGRREALYIVTGCIKSESWAIAAFRHSVPRPDHVSKLVRLPGAIANNNLPTSTYAWRSQGTFDGRTGRSSASGGQDQVLFLRGFKLDISQSFRDQVQREQYSFGGARGNDGDSTDASRPPGPDKHYGDRRGPKGGPRGWNAGSSNKGGEETGGSGGHGAYDATNSDFVTISFLDEPLFEVSGGSYVNLDSFPNFVES